MKVKERKEKKNNAKVLPVASTEVPNEESAIGCHEICACLSYLTGLDIDSEGAAAALLMKELLGGSSGDSSQRAGGASKVTLSQLKGA